MAGNNENFTYLICSKVNEPEIVYYYFNKNEEFDNSLAAIALISQVFYQNVKASNPENTSDACMLFLYNLNRSLMDPKVIENMKFVKLTKSVLAEVDLDVTHRESEWNIYSLVGDRMIVRCKGLPFAILSYIGTFHHYFSSKGSEKMLEGCEFDNVDFIHSKSTSASAVILEGAKIGGKRGLDGFMLWLEEQWKENNGYAEYEGESISYEDYIDRYSRDDEDDIFDE